MQEFYRDLTKVKKPVKPRGFFGLFNVFPGKNSGSIEMSRRNQ